MKKKLKFDFSRFGCNEDAFKGLVEAMGFECETEDGVYVKPGNLVYMGETKAVVVPSPRSDGDKEVIYVVHTTKFCDLEYTWNTCGGGYVTSYPEKKPVLGYADEN